MKKPLGLSIISIKLIVVLYCTSYSAKAQQPINNINLPTIIPPSPAAQNFMRYGEIPVDYSTGVPNISIPLYTAKSRQLSVPISISYHGSGIKVEDKASVIGLGWVLNAGGLVTETLLSGGNPPTYKSAEELNAARLTTSVLNSPNPLDAGNWANMMYLEMNQKPAYVSNRYTFSLPNGESGAFRYDYITGNIIKLPYSSVKISPDHGSNAYVSNMDFTFIDEKGVTYTFKSNDSQPRTWNISSMVSADKTDTIRFVYKSIVNTYGSPAHSSVLQLYEYPSVDPDMHSYSWHCAYNQSNSIGLTGNQTHEQLLDSIITSNTIITLATIGDRQDIASYPHGNRVVSLSVFDRQNNELIKSYNFNQDYFGSAVNKNLRLRLNGLTIKGSDGVGVENYNFSYETGVELPPYPENNVGLYQFAEDYWGYYNGNPSMSKVPMQFTPTSVPNYRQNYPIPVPPENSTNRDPNAYYAKAAMLKEIDYPTGGKTVFTFEPNKADGAYLYPSNFTVPDIVGGFRIQRIDNYSNNGLLTDYKTYTYNLGRTQTIRNELFAQSVRAFIYLLYYAQGQSSNGQSNIPVEVFTDYQELIIGSDSFLPLTCDNGPPVLYTSVTEYIGDANNNAGKTEYTYQTPPETFNPNYGWDNAQYTGSYFFDMGNYVPQLIDKKIYKYSSGGVYTPLKEMQTNYSIFLNQNYPMGYHLLNLNDYHMGIIYDCWNLNYGGYENNKYYGTPEGYNLYHTAADLFIAEDVSATQQINLPTKTIETDFDAFGNTSVVKTTNLSYGGLDGYTLGAQAHLEPTQRSVSMSTGDTYITNLRYPADFSSVFPYNNMLNSNILTPVIQQLNYKNITSNFLNSTTTNYGQWPTMSPGNYIYAPQSVQTQTGSLSPENRINYSDYDFYGNVAGVSKAGGPTTCYIYGYNKTYPIAQVSNSSYAAVLSVLGGQSVVDNFGKQAHPTDTQISSFLAPLRSLPNAQVVTYTYDPLMGMTSMTDAKGMKTTYEYDAFQRLMNVKDANWKILKHTDYHYKQ